VTSSYGTALRTPSYSLVQSGLLLTAGNAADRYGRKKMPIAGLALFGDAGSPAAGLARLHGGPLIGGVMLDRFWWGAIFLINIPVSAIGLFAVVALSMPAMADAIMSAIPPTKAGVGAGVNSTLAELGNGLGDAVLGAVLNPRFTALVPMVVGADSLAAAPAAAGDAGERERISDAYASGLETSQLVGAVAVLAGGPPTAMLLPADRADSPRAAA
jgi:MFS family permease